MIQGFRKTLRAIVTACICSGFSFALEAETTQVQVTKRPLTKEELAAPAPPPESLDLAGLFVKHSVIFLTKMTALQKDNGGLKKIVDDSKPEDFDRTAMRLNALYEYNGTRVDKSEDLKANISTQTSRTATERFKESSTLYKKIKSGLAFDLNLKSAGNLLGSEENHENASSSKIRYGLVVQEITPERARDRASIDTYDELSYSKPARVKYTIAPVDDDSGQVGLIPVPVNYDNPAISESMFENIRKPKGDFAVKVEPADPTPGAGFDPTKLSGNLVISQKDGLYQYKKIVGQNTLAADAQAKYVTHELKVPTYKNLAFGRQYNGDRQPIQTSIYGILVYENLPILNLHYNEIDDKYRAEMILVKAPATIKGNVEMHQGWKPGGQVNQEGDKITIEISRPI